MKEIPLTRGLFTKVGDADYEHLSQWKWSALKSKKRFYAYRMVCNSGKQTAILMHRAIMEASGFSEKVDHINGDSLDNTRANLRICTNAQNCQNRGITSLSKTGYKGVMEKNGVFRVSIGHENKVIYLGTFKTIEDAINAYSEASIRLHKEFAR